MFCCTDRSLMPINPASSEMVMDGFSQQASRIFPDAFRTLSRNFSDAYPTLFRLCLGPRFKA